jgi:ABC-type antimicrobial peptide transport system permease subunit
MAFGILNAMSMAIGDRIGEIGVLLALGMSRVRVGAVLFVEALWLAVVACGTGTSVGGAVIWYFWRRGIDMTRFADAMDFLGVGGVFHPHIGVVATAASCLVMVAVTVAFCLVPVVRACRLLPVVALRRVR